MCEPYCVYDNDLSHVLEPGKTFIRVGSSLEDIHLNGKFVITGAGKMHIKNARFCTRSRFDIPILL